MKCALYARVSKSDDFQDPENQLVRLRAYAQERGLDVYDTYVDRASGANPDRPELERMMADARGNRFKQIVVVKVDRIARSTINLYALIKELVEQKVELVCIDQPEISTSKATGKLLLAVLGGVAEFERDLIRDRTIDGLARAKAQGKCLGRPRKRVDMARARELKAQGLGYRRIAKQLGVSHQTLFLRMKKEGVKGSKESPLIPSSLENGR